MKIVLDAYAWVEIFVGSEKGLKAVEIIQKSEEIYTPDTTLAEIARKYLREGVGESDVAQRLAAMEELSDIVQVDKKVALEAAKCYLELTEKARRENLRPPSLFDGIVLAVARTTGAKVVTGDEHFKELKETIWIGDSNHRV